jgi:hypothetical protein
MHRTCANIPRSMPSSDRVHPARTELQSWVGIAVAIAPAVLAACTLRDGHAWGDDFAQYLVHTRNLVEGKPYGELGFIRAPIHAIAYPPGFPLLLAPVYWVFGGSLTAMKLELALFFAGTMLIVRRHLSRQLPARVGVALVALVAWNPVFWEFRDNILSDIPFLFFVALSFLAADLSEEAERVGSRRWALILLAAASMVMATLCRTLGAVLPFSLLFAGLIRQQRVSRTTAVCLVAVISSLLICAATLPPSGEATALRAMTFGIRHTAVCSGRPSEVSPSYSRRLAWRHD